MSSLDIGRQVLQGQRGIEIEVTNRRKVSHGTQDSLGGQEKQQSRMGGQPSSRVPVLVCRWAVGGRGTPGVILVANWNQEHQVKKPGNKELGLRQSVKKGLSKGPTEGLPSCRDSSGARDQCLHLISRVLMDFGKSEL